MLRAKYGAAGGGGVGALKRKPLIAKDHGKKFFDSADHALAKGKGEKAVADEEESLPPCIAPTAAASARRRSDCAMGLSKHDD